MTATQIDPRTLTETLGLDDTLTLASLFRGWAGERLDCAQEGFNEDFVNYDRLARFDENVAAARVQLLAAIEAEKAWHEDHPLDDVPSE